LGKHFSLTSSDSFKLGAYRADPSGPAKGGIVLIQEIFGVNHHIRAVCDRLAGEGYAALAPAVFDRQQPNFECGYTPDEIANARQLPEGRRRPRLATLHGLPGEEREVVGNQEIKCQESGRQGSGYRSGLLIPDPRCQ